MNYKEAVNKIKDYFNNITDEEIIKRLEEKGAIITDVENPEDAKLIINDKRNFNEVSTDDFFDINDDYEKEGI